MKTYVKFSQLISIWCLLTYVSAKELSECEKDRLIRNDSYHFNYHNFDEWGKMSPLCKNGKQQSPINLGKYVNIYKVQEFPVKISNYDQKLANGIVQNNGHSGTCIFTFTYTEKNLIVPTKYIVKDLPMQLKARWDKNKPTLTGIAVHGQVYEFYSIIVHWGTSDHEGTEHSIRGKKYAAEIHIVQRNVKYPNIKKALSEKDGVIATAILFQHNKVKPPNKGIQEIAKLAGKVSETFAVAETDFDMSLLDFHSIRSFYTYVGSLTRPPCTENIRWFVSAKILPIDDESLKLLRSVKLSNKDNGNIRPLQKAGSRDIKLITKIEEECDA